MKAVLIDDEDSALDALEDELSEFNEVDIAGRFTNPFEALTYIQNSAAKVDIVFLDIEMPGMNGMETAEQIMERDASVDIVFTTAYDRYAVEAFEVNAMDYLLKPVMKERLSKTIYKWRNKSNTDHKPQKLKECRISCFGAFQLYIDNGKEEHVKWRTNKEKELFAYFFHYAEEEIHKSKIIHDIWPEMDEERAVPNLHSCVYYIRKMIRKYELDRYFKVYYTNDSYRFVMDGIASDADEFLLIAEEGMEVTKSTVQTYNHALALYRGDYMGSHDYEWSVPTMIKLQTAYLDMITKLVKFYWHKELNGEAVSLLQEAVAHNPLHEELYEMLLTTYDLMGNGKEIQKYYSRMEKLFREQLCVEPAISLQDIYQKWK